MERQGSARWFSVWVLNNDFGELIDQKAKRPRAVRTGKVVEFLRSSVMVKVAISIDLFCLGVPQFVL